MSTDQRETARKQVLFLCTGNSARSILAESLLRKIDPWRFESSSAGSHPTGTVHPLALRILRDVYKVDASDARSKSWEEFRDHPFDFVITVCDNARESCPIWPGQPVVAHWGVPDPAAVEGTEEQRLGAFREAARVLARRIELFCNLPFEKIDSLRLQQLTREIGAESYETDAKKKAKLLDKAKKEFQSSLGLHPNHDAYLAMGLLQLDLGDPLAAADACNQALALQPGSDGAKACVASAKERQPGQG